jgi:pyridoxal phosphate enzyme (YggS family)
MEMTSSEPGEIAARLHAVQARIRAAAERAGRAPEDVTLLAVSKTHGIAAIRAAYAAGQRAFGESYVQEAVEKIAALRDLGDLEWHFIGRVQSNKARQIAEAFDWVHGVADLGHARRLDAQRPPGRAPLNLCIQVNLSGESSKSGVSSEAVADLIDACSVLTRVRVCGLMTLPAPADSEVAQRLPFRQLRALRDRLATAKRPLDCLSMGMSDDLEAAILEGATLVRVGTSIFGARDAALQT